ASALPHRKEYRPCPPPGRLRGGRRRRHGAETRSRSRPCPACSRPAARRQLKRLRTSGSRFACGRQCFAPATEDPATKKPRRQGRGFFVLLGFAISRAVRRIAATAS